MVENNKVTVKLSDAQLKKVKNALKNKTGTTLRINLKMFNGIIYHMNINSKTKNKSKKCFS